MITAVQKDIKSLHIVINPAAGRRDPILPIFNETFKDTGVDWQVSLTKGPGEGIQLAKEALKNKVDAIGVYGGDGTVREVGSALVGSPVPLVIFPGGTANVMAKELGIPTNLKDACELLTRGPWEIRRIDVGQIRHCHFILRTSLGFEAQMVEGADRNSKLKLGVTAYLLSGLRELSKTELVRYKLNIDGQSFYVYGVTCIIANSGHIGIQGLSLDKHIDVSDGLLDIIVVRKINLSLIRHIAATFWNRERPENLELVKHWQGKDITVSSYPPQDLQCDGEILKGPLHVEIRPSALSVIVPASRLTS